MAECKKRAAAYVRVSSASKAQIHSYEFQEEYWHQKLDEDPNVELVAIYADRGISGSSMNKRQQFNAMLRDARLGNFDVIYTKSVSRFARNTVDLLKAVRELRDIGVEVIFEKEGIHSTDPASELLLTIAAAIAEDDLKVDSERQRWSYKHRFENGWICIGNGVYGYTMGANNNLEIVEDEAAVVRRIYDMYIDGKGCPTIAGILNSEGKSIHGKPWRAQSIRNLIDNEKYMGDSMMGKSMCFNGVRYENMDGRYGQRYYIEDSHTAIVSKETWNKAQELRVLRQNKKLAGKTVPKYPFTGMIECGNCGSHYYHKVNNSGKKWQTHIWVCGQQLKGGVAACNCTNIKDNVLREKFIEAYNEFVTRRPQGDVLSALQSVAAELRQEEKELATLRMQRLIPENAFRAEQQRIKAKIAELTEKINEQRSKDINAEDYVIIQEFDPIKVEKFIAKVIVQKGTVTFEFFNGIRISRPYTNGPSGNRPGWNKREAVQ